MAKPKLKPGRPRIEIDLARVEELAALGLTQDKIAQGLGIHRNTLSRKMQDILIAFEGAVKRGHFTWSEDLLSKAKARLDTGDRTADNLLMFSLKQQHGPGFMDERSIRHSGSIEHVVRAVDVAWDRRREMIEQAKVESQPVIEAEFTEVVTDVKDHSHK